MSGDPHAEIEARTAARHLMLRPLTCGEHDPEIFRLIRRHSALLDRWFTQRFGDRVHVDIDTARLYKSIPPISPRPLRTGTGRPLRPVEYVMLSLTLAAVASGPDVISLRDLVAAVRSAAAEAEIALDNDASERRALVTALQWMIAQGLMAELHDHVERYGSDDEADAVLRVRADRIALIALSEIVDATSADDLLHQASLRGTPRQQMRSALANDPVLYRDDVSVENWVELRRRLGDESMILDEMLGLGLEARAEGVAAIDPAGTLTDRRFPSSGTEAHAALLLIDELVAGRTWQLDSPDQIDGPAGSEDPVESGGSTESDDPTESYDPTGEWLARPEIVEILAEISVPHTRRWRSELVDNPNRLADVVIDLLVELRLAEKVDRPDRVWQARLRPAAARFTVAAGEINQSPDGSGAHVDPQEQPSLW
ncbi:MAG: TIGR02678 family protein [Microthrixaceae bacterium]